MRRENWGDFQIQWAGGLVGNRFPYQPKGDLTGLYRRLGIPPSLTYTRTRAGPAFYDARGPDLQAYLEQLKEEALRPVRWMSRQAELLWTPLGEGRLRRALLRALPSAMLLAALAQPRPAKAGPPIALGNEFQVNTYFDNEQYYASVAVDADGDFVIAWHGRGFGDPNGVFAQRFDSNGNAVGTEFRVNTYTTNAQVLPSVAMDADGDFVVAWQSWMQDGDNYGVYARVYASDGTPVTGELQVNTYTNYIQNEPSVAMDEDGNFVVAWVDGLADGSTNGIFARRYDSTGTPLDATEFQVNTYTTGYQNSPSVAADADGDFVIAWEGGNSQDGSGYGVFAQRYTSDGNPAGSEFQVNVQYLLPQREPDVAMDADGDFVIAWEDNSYDGSQYGVFARRYDSSGAALDTTEFQVNTYTASDQRKPSVAMDADGDFVIAWHSYGQDGSTWGVFACRFDGAGNATGVDFPVNTYSTSAQAYPTVAMDADGDFVTAWHSYGQDGSTYGIFAQRFSREVSDEFLVNDYLGSQYNAAMAMDADGDFVVAWEGFGPGDTHGVFGQRYSSDGTPVNSEFLINTVTNNQQRWPSVAMDADGDFVVVWQSWGQDGQAWGVFARRYDGAGDATGVDFVVNTYWTGGQAYPTVAMDADGDFVVAWESSAQDGDSYGVFAQLYTSDGNPVGIEFRVNTYTFGAQRRPSVAVDTDGDFVISWHGLGPGDSDGGVFARRYNSSGVAQEATEFRVNTYTTSGQLYPSVAMDSDGDFVVAWESYLQDGSTLGVFAQRYSSDGTPVGSEFQANTYVTLAQQNPSAAMDADGEFVIAWVSEEQDGSDEGVFARRYTSAGTAVGPEFRVPALTGNSQNNPSAAMDDEGDFGVAWESRLGTEFSIHARLYDRLKRAFLPLVMRNY